MTPGKNDRTSGPAAGAADLPLDGVRVLIAEDEVTIRRLLASYLARRGAAVHQAANGEEALAQLEIEDMDIVIADIRMPRMDGLEMFERLRARRPGMLPRVLFLSGDFSQIAEREDMHLPDEQIMVKPIELTEVERRILERLRRD